MVNDKPYPVEIDAGYRKQNYWVICWPTTGTDMTRRFKSMENATNAIKRRSD